MNITSANATILLSVPLLFPAPVQLQKFAADDIFGTDPIQTGEVQMGVDGHLTAGFTNVPTKQAYALMADSDSNFFFDQIALREKADQTKYEINGVVLLTSVGTKWTMTRGFMTMWQPIPDAKKVLQPRKHTIEWERVVPTPS
jgi:hypothetical protein